MKHKIKRMQECLDNILMLCKYVEKKHSKNKIAFLFHLSKFYAYEAEDVLDELREILKNKELIEDDE